MASSVCIFVCREERIELIKSIMLLYMCRLFQTFDVASCCPSKRIASVIQLFPLTKYLQKS